MLLPVHFRESLTVSADHLQPSAGGTIFGHGCGNKSLPVTCPKPYMHSSDRLRTAWTSRPLASVRLEIPAETISDAMSVANKRLRSYFLVLSLLFVGLLSAPEAQAAGPYMLDDHAGAKAAYSLRRLTTAYAGPAVRVHRMSDGAQQDIGFVNDQLDVAALTSFVGNSSGVVVTWYSQIPGVPNARAVAPDTAPIIAEGGNVIRDEGGYVAIKFVQLANSSVPGTHLNVSGMVPYSSQEIAVLAVLDPESPDDSYAGNLFVARNVGEWGYAATRVRVNNGFASIEAGDGSNATRITEIPISERRGIYTFVAAGNALQFYRNQNLLRSETHTRAAYTTDGITIGGDSRDGQSGYSGYLSELVVYPSTITANRESLYLNANAAWQTGPTSWNANTILPQDWQYQVTLYDWLQSLSLADVALTPAPLVWDGTYTSPEQLANLWLSLENRPLAARATVGQACWFILDDGNGCGIEATGDVRLYYKGGPVNTGAFGNDPAFWYQLDVPISGGGQGNPYYQNPSVARRALVVAIVEMLMWDQSIEQTAASARNDFFGKAVSSWAYIYHHTKDILSSTERTAFETGLGRFLDHTIRLGANDVNTNMDMFAVNGAAGVYASTDNPELKSKAIQAAKRLLFGYPDGVLGVKHDAMEGTFFPAGYIAEADGPETTYNGHSFAQLVGALSWVHEDPQWDFLEEVVSRMARFKAVQYFYDPGVGGGPRFYDGPAGYANRTGGSYVRDQGGSLFRDLTAAALVEEARPFLRPYVYFNDPRIKSIGDMGIELSQSIAKINESGFGVVDTATPPRWSPGSSWPEERAYLPPAGWYSELGALLSQDDPTTMVPFERPGNYFSELFGEAPTGVEFWAHRATDGNREFGFFVEADAAQGGYPGWYGGKVELFWTRDTGMLVMNRHDKTGCDPATEENTTCWDQIDYWALNHVWGRDEGGNPFSGALVRGRNLSRTSTASVSGLDGFAEVVTSFNDPSAAQSSNGEQTGSELSGNVSVTNRFETMSNGLRVRHTVSSDQADEVRELWATIPVYLRYNLNEQGGQASIPDATIEYWDGAAWRALTTTPVSASKLRIGRNFLDGQGARYGYIGFWNDDDVTPRNRSVKLSSKVWEESFQGYSRIRNVHIDLHGAPGTVKTIPAESAVVYTLQTTDPGSAPGETGMVEQRIELQAGWNYVARGVEPADAQMSVMMAESAASIGVVRSESGAEYVPSLGTDGIGEWSKSEAYEVFATAATTITMRGTELDPLATPITLSEGMNLVPFLLSEAMPVEQALASILPDVVLVKDAQGKLYNPSFGINTLGELRPGVGYKILASRAVTLTYPNGQLP